VHLTGAQLACDRSLAEIQVDIRRLALPRKTGDMRRTVLALVRLAASAALVFGLFQVLAPGSATAATAVAINGGASCSGSAFCFAPSAVTVPSGDTVTWTNQSAATHTVTRCNPAACNGTDGGTGTDPAFDHQGIAPSGSASQQFTGAGTYNYYCTIHGFAVMHGTVTVQGQAGPTTTAAQTPTSTTATTAAPSTSPGSTTATTTPTPAAAPAAAVAGQVNFTG
jgi:plastocyanin